MTMQQKPQQWEVASVEPYRHAAQQWQVAGVEPYAEDRSFLGRVADTALGMGRLAQGMISPRLRPEPFQVQRPADPRDLSAFDPQQVASERARLQAINPSASEQQIDGLLGMALRQPKGEAATLADRFEARFRPGGDEANALSNALFDRQLEQRLNQPFQQAEPSPLTGERIGMAYRPELQEQQTRAYQQELDDAAAEIREQARLSRLKKATEESPLAYGAVRSMARFGAGLMQAPGTFERGMRQFHGLDPSQSLIPQSKTARRVFDIIEATTPELARVDLWEDMDAEHFWPALMVQVAENSVSNVLSLVAIMSPPLRAFTLGSMGAMAAGNAELAGDSPLAATAKGAVEVGTELAFVKGFDKISEIIQRVPKSQRATFLNEVTGRLLSSGQVVTMAGLTGAVEEAAAQVGGNLVERWVDGRDTPIMDGVGSAAILGAASGGLIATPSAVATGMRPGTVQGEFAQALDAGEFAPLGDHEMLRQYAMNQPGATVSPEFTSLDAAAAGAWAQAQAERQAKDFASIGEAKTVDEAIVATQKVVQAGAKAQALRETIVPRPDQDAQLAATLAAIGEPDDTQAAPGVPAIATPATGPGMAGAAATVAPAQPGPVAPLTESAESVESKQAALRAEVEALRQARAERSKPMVLQNRNRATPSSIAQMSSIAARPDYGRLGFSRDFANGAPVVAGELVAPEQMGRQDVAVASDGRRIPVQYAVVEADAVLTSNNADGTGNADYGNAQVRALRAIAGNGRVAGVRAAYSRGTAGDYRQEMAADTLHGVDRRVIEGMERPVLVRVMPDEHVSADIGDVSNTVGNLDLSAVEQARNDSQRVNLEALQFSEDGAITPEAVRQFVRAMPQAEQGGLMDTNGQPTRQAVDRLNAAVFALAYGNDGLVRLYAQAQDPEARLIMSALAQAAPKMARLQGAGALDIRDVVTQAAEIAVNARREGRPLTRAAQQLDLTADPDVGVVLDLFARNARSVKPVVEALGAAADMAYTEATKPDVDMFGAVPRASRSNIINQLRPEHERRSQANLENPAGREPAQEDAGGRAATAARPADPGRTQAGRPADAGVPEQSAGAVEVIESYTQKDVEDRLAKLEQAEQERKQQEREAEQKARADAMREDFTLTGSDRDADVAAARGQSSLFEPEQSYNANYETDLFGNPVPAPARGDRGAKSRESAEAGNVHPAAAVPGDTPAPQGEYFVRTIVGKTHDRQLGSSRILTPEDAAQATAYLYRSAIERVDAIVTDEAGKPLAVVGGFKGATGQASVFPGVVAGEAVRVPGAARIWFSHNHPSGNARLSQADLRLNAALADVFRGSGIEPMGLLAVAGGRFAYATPAGTESSGLVAAPISKGPVVPVMEREQIPGDADRFKIENPPDAIQEAVNFYRQSDSPGLMLLDAQHSVSAWVPLPSSMRGALRNTGGLNAIYRAVSESNASAAIIVHGGELDALVGDSRVTAAENIGAALAQVEVRPLDIINAQTRQSMAQEGRSLAAGPVFSRRATAPEDATEDSPSAPFWQKIQGGHAFTDEEIAHAYGTGTRGTNRKGVVVARQGVEGRDAPGHELVRWSRKAAGFPGHRTVAHSDSRGIFTVAVLPDETLSVETTKPEAVSSAALVQYRFTPIGGAWQLDIKDPTPGGRAFNALRAIGRLEETPHISSADGKPSYRAKLDNRHSESSAFLQEAVRRLGLHIGEVPTVMTLGRETGARADTAQMRVFGPEAIATKFSRLGGQAEQVARHRALQDQSSAAKLNAALVKYGLGNEWSQAYEAVELPDALSRIREEIQAAFGRDIRPVAPTAARFDVFNGVHVGGETYVNVDANVGFVNIAGHELLHDLKRTRPDLYSWFAAQADGYLTSLDEYRAKLDRLLQAGEKPHTAQGAKEELIADFAGDALADPAFLTQLAQADGAKFKGLLNAVIKWLAAVGAKLRGLESSQYVTDVDVLRQHLMRALLAYSSGAGIDRIAELHPTQTQAFKRWFGDSKVVDAEGNPLVVYHGTDNDIAIFNEEMRGRNTAAGSARKGFFFAASPRTTYAYMVSGVTGTDATMLYAYGKTYESLVRDGKAWLKAEGKSPDGLDAYFDHLDKASATSKIREEKKRRLNELVGRRREGFRLLPEPILSKESQEEVVAIKEWLKEDLAMQQLIQNDAMGNVDMSGLDENEHQELWDKRHGWRKAGANIMPAYLSIQNPAVFDDEGRGYREQSYAERIAIAVAGGHDGVIIKNTQDGFEQNDDIYVVFSPTQIKSATGNKGTFDPASPDIRFSRKAFRATAAQTQNQPTGLKNETRWGWSARKMQDAFRRVNEVQDAVVARGGVLNDLNNTYQAETLIYGRTQEALTDFRDLRVQPLMRQLTANGLTADELALFAYAMHAPSRNAYIASINPNMPDGGSGMTDAEAKAILDAFDRDGKTANLKVAHAELMEWTRMTRQQMLRDGLIGQDQFDAWEGMWENYVPLKNIEETLEDDVQPVRRTGGRGFNIRGKETMAALGRATRAGQIVEHTIKAYEQALERGERNRVTQVFYQFVLDNPDSTLWEVDKVKTKLSLNRGTGTVDRRLVINKGPDTVALKINGREIFISVKDPLMARALRRDSRAETAAVEAAIAYTVGPLTALLRNTLTRYNPEFAAINTARDIGFGTAAMKDEMGNEAAARFLGNVPGANAAYATFLIDRKSAAKLHPQWHKWLTEFRAAGGTTGGFFMQDMETISGDIRDLMLEAGAAPANWVERLKAGRVAGMPYRNAVRALKVLEFAGQVSENGIRLAAYRTAREMGKTPAQAARIAKDLTTNFNRKGEWGQSLNGLFLFYNAAIQGAERTYRMMRNPKMWVFFTGVIAGTVALTMLNAQIGGEDDDGELHWDKIPQRVKERNLIIMLPPGVEMVGAEQVGSKGRYISIPMQYGLNFFTVAGYALADAARNAIDPTTGITPVRAAANIVATGVESMNPFGGSPDNANAYAMAILPTFGDVVYQFGAGVDGFGRPTSPPTYGREDSMLMSENVNARQQERIFHDIARGMNRLTGGDEAEQGFADFAPGTYENLWRNLTGGTGKFLTDTYTMAEVMISPQGRELYTKDVPIFRRLYGELDADASQRLFYERRNQVRAATDEDKRREDIGEETTDPRKRAMLDLSDDANRATRELRDIRKQERETQGDETLTTEERNARLLELKAEKARATDDFLLAWNEAMRRWADGDFD